MNIEQRPSSNFYDLEYPADIIVLHTTLGSFEGTIAHLSRPNNPSSHFVIGRLGQIAQLVQLDKGAWHAGRINNPNKRAKTVLKKTIWGNYKNPNKYSWGFEFASGYDIDRDGVLESWEKLYTPQQIKAGVLLHLWCEEQRRLLYRDSLQNRIIDNSHVLIHKDITSYKPDLEIHRLMYLSELQKQRELQIGNSTVVEERNEEKVESSGLVFELGKTYRPQFKDGKIIFIKV